MLCFLRSTPSRSPALPPLIIAEQKMCVYSYNSASSETLWTGIKVKGCEVDGSGRELKRREKKNSWRCVFENARPDMIGEKSILLKMRDGSTESPSVSDSIKDGAGIISHWKAGTDLQCDLAKN